MRTQIATRPLPPLPDNPYLPHQARITSIRRVTADHHERFGTITLMHGAKTPAHMLFRDELEALAGTSSINTLLTVDRDPTGTWEHEIGLLPTLFNKVQLEPRRTNPAVGGPPRV